MSDPRRDEQRRSNITLLKKLTVIVIGMFGFGYALVPFYDKICEAAGLRNIAEADEAVNTQVDAKRDVRIARRASSTDEDSDADETEGSVAAGTSSETSVSSGRR